MQHAQYMLLFLVLTVNLKFYIVALSYSSYPFLVRMELIFSMCFVRQRAAAVEGEPPDQGCSERETVVSRGGADDHTHWEVRAYLGFIQTSITNFTALYSSESERERRLKEAEEECASLKKKLVSLSVKTVL